MSEVNHQDVRSRITECFASLDVKNESDIPIAVSTAMIIITSPGPINNHYYPKGSRGVTRELEELVKSAKKLASTLDDLHKPTCDLLRDAGIRPEDALGFCSSIINKVSEIDASFLPENVPRRRTQFRADYLYQSGVTETHGVFPRRRL